MLAAIFLKVNEVVSLKKLMHEMHPETTKHVHVLYLTDKSLIFSRANKKRMKFFFLASAGGPEIKRFLALKTH